MKKDVTVVFGSMKKGIDSSADIETIIGRNTQLKGEISGEGNIRIDGKVSGEITVRSDVVVGEQGEIAANIQAANLLISGLVKGNVVVSGKLEILGTGKLYGDVRAAVLSIAEGAVFKGNSDMDAARGGLALEEAAPPTGKKG